MQLQQVVQQILTRYESCEHVFTYYLLMQRSFGMEDHKSDVNSSKAFN